MNPQLQLNVVAALASVIKESGSIAGRIRIQKTAYLLQQMEVEEFCGVDFFYHHYGPYSEEVSEVLQRAVRAGLVNEKAESFDDEWQRYEYALLPEGEKYAALVDSDSLAKIKSLLRKTVDLHWRALELAATALFLQKKEQLAVDEAMKRALSLKPACAAQENAALTALKEMGLAVCFPT